MHVYKKGPDYFFIQYSKSGLIIHDWKCGQISISPEELTFYSKSEGKEFHFTSVERINKQALHYNQSPYEIIDKGIDLGKTILEISHKLDIGIATVKCLMQHYGLYQKYLNAYKAKKQSSRHRHYQRTTSAKTLHNL